MLANDAVYTASLAALRSAGYTTADCLATRATDGSIAGHEGICFTGPLGLKLAELFHRQVGGELRSFAGEIWLLGFDPEN